MRGTISPMMLERRLRREDAMLLWRYPISSAIALTRRRVASLIRGLLLSALDTVAGDTPSALAMSTMLFSDFGLFGIILSSACCQSNVILAGNANPLFMRRRMLVCGTLNHYLCR